MDSTWGERLEAAQALWGQEGLIKPYRKFAAGDTS